MKKARLLLNTKSNLGEGSWFDWRTNELIWLDVFCGLVHKTDVKTMENKTWEVPGIITTIVPDDCGGYAAAMKDGVYALDGNFRAGGKAVFARMLITESCGLTTASATHRAVSG